MQRFDEHLFNLAAGEPLAGPSQLDDVDAVVIFCWLPFKAKLLERSTILRPFP